ncbi:actin-like [Rhinatrema bivittatum]|uniref:actin-like n=1 Tax=Rhinatrema bivittatum TaxID=194408 RepID=UPI0011262037|nr:actin-like [Rhinatrema bivittatum]
MFPQDKRSALTIQVATKVTGSKQFLKSDREWQIFNQSEGSQAASTSQDSQIPALPVKKTVAVVIDTGTGISKAGMAGEQKPSSLVSTLVGYPLKKSLKCGNIRDPFYIGSLALIQPDVKIIEPVRHGIIVDWEAIETLWRHTFYYDLKTSPEEHAILLSDPPLSPTTNREKLVEVLFESMHSLAMYVSYQSVLSTYSYGKVSGLVVESGYGVTHTVPVFQGYILPHATERMDIAGKDLTTHLMKLLQKSACMFTEKTRHIVEDIKQKCCYVALDYECELCLPENEYLVDYKLPDGQVITIGKERFQCPEILFKPPQMEGVSLAGIHFMAQRSLQKIPEESKKEIQENIFLCGGSTLYEGFTERFTKELLKHQPQHKSNVLSVPEREYSTWLGGSILASLTSFQSCWIHAQQYKEYGPHIVYRKCY